MANPGPNNSINDRAVQWAVEAAYGELSPESRTELDAWLDMDPRHRGAFVRARAWIRATENAVVETHPVVPVPLAPVSHNDNLELTSEPPLPRHGGLAGWGGKMLLRGGVVAASLAVLATVSQPFLFRATPPRVEQVMRLQDGSVATLRDGARIEVAILDGIRRITLLSGEASFEVAKDKERPFVVRSGDVYAQATGTVYSVRRVGKNGGTVKVFEGSVLVWPHDDRDQAVQLRAGGLLTLDPGKVELTPTERRTAPPPLPSPELAQISLDNVRVKAAVARFNRVNSTKIVVADPTIDEIEIIGLYKANDPEQFAQAVSLIAGGYVEKRPGKLVIKMK